MPPRRRPATQRDVADGAGVSTATVSYILNGRRDRSSFVTEETRERVLRVAEELGYWGNHAARSLRQRRTELVCVVYRPPSNPWIERLIEQLHDAAVPRGYAVITVPVSPEDPTGTVLRVLREQYVDGAVVTPGYCFPSEELTTLARHGLALVVFDDEIAPEGFDVVRQRQAEACRAAVDHLLDRGHRRIAYLGHGNRRDGLEDDVKYAGYRTALAGRGVEIDRSLTLAAADSRTEAYVAAKSLLNAESRPTAVFSASDRAAIEAIRAAHDMGLGVPSDVAVLGVGNTGEGEVITPALSSVGMPAFDFTVGIDRLFERISDATDGGIELSRPWEPIIRGST